VFSNNLKSVSIANLNTPPIIHLHKSTKINKKRWVGFSTLHPSGFPFTHHHGVTIKYSQLSWPRKQMSSPSIGRNQILSWTKPKHHLVASNHKLGNTEMKY